MNITITNSKPAVLDPSHKVAFTGDFDINQDICTNISEKMCQSMNGNGFADIDVDGQKIGPDEITELVFECLGETYNPDAEEVFKLVAEKTLMYYTPNNETVMHTYAYQSGHKEKLLAPSQQVRYIPNDLIDVSKERLAGICSDDKCFATFAYYSKIDAYGVGLLTDDTFETLKEYVRNQVAMIVNKLDQDTIDKFDQFDDIKLNNLTESIIVRNNYDEGNEEFSFARLIHRFINDFADTCDDAFLMPFNVAENFVPKNIIFTNIERHAHGDVKQIAAEWKTITKCILRNQMRIIPLNKLAKLTATDRALQKMQTMSKAAGTFGDPQRSKVYHFKKAPMKVADLFKVVATYMKKVAKVNYSENPQSYMAPSFLKPNRRHPEDGDYKGVIKRTEYKPDIHIYADCSGSISEENYRGMMKTCIALAKKMDVNLYFNSFSHYLSGQVKIPVKGRTVSQIYGAFQKVPKVDGGTDFSLVWSYINTDPTGKRQKELSILITDFEYWPPNRWFSHPKNLYYAPVDRGNYDWIIREADSFCHSMEHQVPDIRKKIWM